jgi:tripartite-type tricarboxylate transporter receptor subunit TctC
MLKRITTLVGLWCLALGGMPAHAQQDFPRKPIRLVVPFAAAGTTDILSRLLADAVGKSVGQQVVLDFRPGAAGTIGADLVAKSEPDGYTIVMGTLGTHSTSPSLYKTLPYDPQRDFEPITLVAMVPNVVVVHPSVPVKTIGELIALAKEKPGTLNYGSAGIGASTHLTGEVFRLMADVDIVHVPYKGSGQALIDLVGGQIPLMFENMPGAMGHVRQGALRAIGVTGPKRSPALPDVPTVAESGVPGFDVVSWFALFAPAKTPKPIVDKLNAEFVAAINRPDIHARMIELGAEPAGGTPEELRDLTVRERERWAKIIKDAGITVN